jgi:hypothetical protein
MTVGALQGLLSPGDTGHLRRGSDWYGGFVFSKSGSRGNLITYKPYGADGDPAPILRHSGQWSRAATFTGSYIRLEGIHITDAQEAGIIVESGANNNEFVGLEIAKAGTGILFNGGDDCLVERCYIHDLVMVVNTQGGDDDYGATGIIIQRGSSGHQIRYCIFQNCIAPSYDYGTDGGMLEFFGDGVSNNYIHHCYAENCDGAFECGSRGMADTQENNRFAYCLLVNNGLVGGMHMGGASGVTVRNMSIENCTVYESDPRHELLLFWYASPSPNTLKLTNCILWSANRAMCDADGFAHTHNNYYRADSGPLGLTLGATELNADPRFQVDGSDFHLTKDSPGRNKGTNLGHVSDYDGAALQAGQVPDMGAFEYAEDVVFVPPWVDFSINHATGDLKQYSSSSTNGDNLSVAAAAALGGTEYGLSCVLSDANPMYGQKDISSPTSGKLRWRFYVDPNSMTMANGDAFVIQGVYAKDVSPMVEVYLKYDGGDYQIHVDYYGDAGYSATHVESIADAPHYVEIYVQKATDASAHDGVYELQIEGRLVNSLSAVDNFDLFNDVDFFRMGACTSIPAGTSGTFYLDELKANDDGQEIGPVPAAGDPFPTRPLGIYLALPGLRGLWAGTVDGSGNWIDLAGHARNLSYNGDPILKYHSAGGVYWDLDGIGDFLHMPDTGDMDISGTETFIDPDIRGLTIGGWFLSDTSPAEMVGLFGKYAAAGNQRSYSLHIAAPNQFAFGVSGDGTSSTFHSVTSAPFSPFTWYFLVGRFRPSAELALFTNNIKTTNTSNIPAKINSGAASLVVGALSGGANLLKGCAALCFLCGAALPDNLILQLYDETVGLFDPSSAAAVMWDVTDLGHHRSLLPQAGDEAGGEDDDDDDDE